MSFDRNWRFNMSDALQIVLDAFPDTNELIWHLYEIDNEFKMLCRDYADALKAIEMWRQSIKTEAPERVTEYQSLVKELQMDIRQYLQKSARK